MTAGGRAQIRVQVEDAERGGEWPIARPDTPEKENELCPPLVGRLSPLAMGATAKLFVKKNYD